MRLLIFATLVGLGGTTALAGPPYVTDDPVPTEQGHTETYLFTQGTTARTGWGEMTGVDFNYGGAKDLQLTASLPLERDAPRASPATQGLGNIELAAKYRFLHQDTAGVDVAFFPRVILPSLSGQVGDPHATLLLPVWIGRSGDFWGSFGGGGCARHRGGDAKDYCTLGWAVTAQIAPKLQIGAELYHQTADARGGSASTSVGAGILYDVSEHLHLLASAGPGLEHRATTDQAAWYGSILLTY